MKIEEIRSKNAQELNAILFDLKKESFNLRFQKIASQATSTSRVRIIRKLIARIKTIINERLKLQSGERNA